MRSLIALVFATAFGAGALAAPAKPSHVMSLTLCTDQLILQLLPKDRIASVSFLSLESQHAYFTAEAAHVPVNYGSLEEVLAERPDLVVAGTAATATTREFLRRANIPLLQVPLAQNFDDVRRVTREIAHAVGEDAKGEALLARMDKTLAGLAATRPRRRIVAAAWGAAGEVPGEGTRFDAILSAAGAVNAARLMTHTGLGSLDLERLLQLRPDLLVIGDTAADTPGLRRDAIAHPVIRRAFAGREYVYPEDLYACGLPQSADAAKALQDAMRTVAGKTAP
jgi:iron complex transport system substrate-binding protein